jgi:hypothetical protein
MSPESEGLEFLADNVSNPETQWSLGTFGALAEFVRDPDEPARVGRKPISVFAVTLRGGIRLTQNFGMRIIAFETTTREAWSQRVALCLPENNCVMSRRAVLTELGPDRDALRNEDRGAVLFDLGLGALQTDLCIRVADSELINALKPYLGRPVFEPGNPVLGVIIAASPHRVFISRVGRIEVFQSIPAAGASSPIGPHTHVLPDLLRHKRTHAATEPIPEGWVPCAHMYPAHAARDGMGHRRPFDATRHAAFQEMLRRFGDSSLVDLKHRIINAVQDGKEPTAVAMINSRFARANIRVALRQLKAAGTTSRSLSAWLATHDRAELVDADEPAHDDR